MRMGYLPKNGLTSRIYRITIWIISLCCAVCEGLEDVNFIDVSCNYANVVAEITFRDVFKGIVFPEGKFFSPNCRFSSPDIGTKKISFFLPVTDCGNLIREKNGDFYVSNKIVVQKHPIIETDSDIVYKTSCKLPGLKTLNMQAFLHERHPHHVRSDELDAYMNFQLGGHVLGFDVSNKLFVGDEFTIVIYVKDGEVHNDFQVESCWAYEGETIESSIYVLKIYDIFKCENEWISGFNFTKGVENVSKAILQGNLKAFKFPVSKNLHITCSVEACTERCYKRYCGPELEKSNYQSKRQKRSTNDIPDRSLRERYRLMKATIKALGTKLMERNRKLSENEANFHRRSATYKELTTLSENNLEDNDNSTDIAYEEITAFNVTNNVVVCRSHELSLKHEYTISPVLKPECVSKLHFAVITAVLSFAIFCLILVCIGFVLYIRKEKKKNHIDGFLLYNLY